MGTTGKTTVIPELFRGKFIVFDGIDGSGKDSVAKQINERIVALNIATISVADPGGTHICNTLRDILLKHNPAEKLTRDAEMLLFTAARAQLLNTRIRPALQDHICVLCSRWVYSTYAYQGAGRKHSVNHIKMLHDYACGSFMPSVALFFDVPVSLGKERRETSGELDRIEQHFKGIDGDPNFYERVRTSYLEQACAIDNYNIHVIDGTKPLDEVVGNAWETLVNALAA